MASSTTATAEDDHPVASAGRPHHSEMVLGMLIEVLHCDHVASQGSFARERRIALVIPHGGREHFLVVRTSVGANEATWKRDPTLRVARRRLPNCAFHGPALQYSRSAADKAPRHHPRRAYGSGASRKTT